MCAAHGPSSSQHLKVDLIKCYINHIEKTALLLELLSVLFSTTYH